MPRKQPPLKVKVKDEGKRSGKRRLSIEVIGDPKMFDSSDAFAVHGAVSPLSLALKDAVTKEVERYWEKGDEVMAMLGKMMKKSDGIKASDEDQIRGVSEGIKVKEEKATNPTKTQIQPKAR